MEKLKRLPVYWQLLILVLVGAMLYGAFWYTVSSGMYTEAAQIKEQSDTIQRKNEQARIATQNIEQFRQLYTAKNAEYEELKVLLPEQREITNVQQGLQDTARASNLLMMRFTPKDDATQGFIASKPVEVEVVSDFGNLRRFYEQIAKMPRIVSVTDFNIKQLPKQVRGATIDAKFLLTAYYAAPEPPPAPPAAPGAKPGTPPAPPAANAPAH